MLRRRARRRGALRLRLQLIRKARKRGRIEIVDQTRDLIDLLDIRGTKPQCGECVVERIELRLLRDAA